MSDKIGWLLMEYDKIHEKSGLVTSGAFSEKFVEWVIKKTLLKNQRPTTNSTTSEICPHYYEDRFPVGDSDTNFERVSCCRVLGKLHQQAINTDNSELPSYEIVEAYINSVGYINGKGLTEREHKIVRCIYDYIKRQLCKDTQS